MGAEFDALLVNGTWSLCLRPSHKNVICNKWVFKLKQKPNGTIDRYKAWLVAKGFEQLDGLDYNETFSPVFKPASTIRLLLALAMMFNWPICQLDVSSAFLHGFLDDEVFMEQPMGFVDSSNPTLCVDLEKCFMGLNKHHLLGIQGFLNPC